MTNRLTTTALAAALLSCAPLFAVGCNSDDPATDTDTDTNADADEAAVADAADQLDFAAIAGDNASADEVSSDLNLPTTLGDGVSVTWTSDPPGVIGDDGTVTPSACEAEQAITLTATLSKGNASTTVTFSITVLGGGGTDNDDGFAATGGDGSQSAPFVICTDAHLDNMRNHLDSHFSLMGSIDLSTNFGAGEGWEPIGTDDDPFMGTFTNGNDYVISGLFIDRDANAQGLFGRVDSATITGIILDGVDVSAGNGNWIGGLAGDAVDATITGIATSGSVSGASSVGGLVGRLNDSVVQDASSACTVSGSGVSVGGLLGFVSESDVTRSYAIGNVTGDGNDVGGFAGYITGSTVDQSFATGDVLNTGGDWGSAGFASGAYESTISNSYATGKAEGIEWVGGFLAYGEDGTVLTNCYATGEVTGDDYVGGLVGGNEDPYTVNSSYWDTTTSGTEDSDSGEGRTTAQMYQQATFVDWDFAAIWTIDEGVSYPRLQWED